MIAALVSWLPVPLRLRLTLWYVALLTLILTIFSGIVYSAINRNLHVEQDDLLMAEAQGVVDHLRPGVPASQDSSVLDPLSHGTQVAIYEASDSRLLAGQRIPGQDGAVAPPLTGSLQIRNETFPDGSQWRVLVRTLPDTGSGPALLEVARSDRELQSALRNLVVTMVVTFPAVLLVASAGGIVLAGKVLNPIDSITRAAESIGANDLSQRLNMPGHGDELGRLAETFDRMLARLEMAFQRQRQFTADASHELRTPLALLVSQVDVALVRPRTALEYQNVLQSVREDAQRMAILVSELLTLARSDADQEWLERERLDLSELVSDTVGVMVPVAEARGVALSQEADGPAIVRGDQTRLTQLALNLIDNALKYTPAGGSVSVIVGQAGRWATLRVADTGIGISPKHLARIFDRFFRADDGRSRAQGGYGLGLSMVQRIAHAHGGTVEVTSQLDHGTTFTVRLPRANADLHGN